LQQRALKPRKRAGKSPFELSPDDLLRRFRFEKEVQVNETYSYVVTKEQTMELLDKYVEINLRDSADMDPTDYSILKGTDFQTEEARAAYYCNLHPPIGYYVDFPNPRYIKIKMLVDPCRSKSNDLCCDGSSESVCEDNTRITSGTDIGLAWFVNGYILQCSQLYRDQGICGTYIEIHKPNCAFIEE